MSFNFLPDELVAQMSSHLDYKDIANLLETQKRINRALKNFKMDRPDVYQLHADYKFEPPRFSFSFEKYQTDKLMNLSFGKEITLAVALSKFRSVDQLHFIGGVLTDDVADSIMKSKVKNLVLILTELRLSTEKLVFFSKKFSSVTFYDCKGGQQRINDNLLCQIVTSTKVDAYFLTKDETVVLNLSDQFLDSMISGKPSKVIHADHYTLFTVNGICRFLEDCIRKNHSFNANFGILHKDQQDVARVWYRYIQAHPELPYAIMEIECEMRVFCITSDSPRISFLCEIAKDVQ